MAQLYRSPPQKANIFLKLIFHAVSENTKKHMPKSRKILFYKKLRSFQVETPICEFLQLNLFYLLWWLNLEFFCNIRHSNLVCLVLFLVKVDWILSIFLKSLILWGAQIMLPKSTLGRIIDFKSVNITSFFLDWKLLRIIPVSFVLCLHTCSICSSKVPLLFTMILKSLVDVTSLISVPLNWYLVSEIPFLLYFRHSNFRGFNMTLFSPCHLYSPFKSCWVSFI